MASSGASDERARRLHVATPRKRKQRENDSGVSGDPKRARAESPQDRISTENVDCYSSLSKSALCSDKRRPVFWQLRL